MLVQQQSVVISGLYTMKTFTLGAHCTSQVHGPYAWRGCTAWVSGRDFLQPGQSAPATRTPGMDIWKSLLHNALILHPGHVSGQCTPVTQASGLDRWATDQSNLTC